jgi:hypothetical protein
LYFATGELSRVDDAGSERSSVNGSSAIDDVFRDHPRSLDRSLPAVGRVTGTSEHHA